MKLLFRFLICSLLLILHSTVIEASNGQCSAHHNTPDHECGAHHETESSLYTDSNRLHSDTRYLLYDVNIGEGFNLRLDVYMRMAALVHRLGPRWMLVLPEWTQVPHWIGPSDPSTRKWSTYYDLTSLGRFVHVLETEHLVQRFNQTKVPVDSVLSLEHSDHFEEDVEFTEMYDINERTQTRNYEADQNGVIRNQLEPSQNNVFDFKRLYEIKLEGFDSTMFRLINKHFAHSRILLISNAEVVLHSNFGDRQFWEIRRSLRYSANLRSIADYYRSTKLNSTDKADRTVMEPDWRTMQRKAGDALGGPYLAVHFRRQDFVRYKSNKVPVDVHCALRQIAFLGSAACDTHFENIYISTDADAHEWSEVKRALEAKGHRVFNFEEDTFAVSGGNKLSPGEVAIVDQLICAHARLFVGTLESNFSYQIEEEREILGFTTNTTFNALCPRCDLRLMLKTCKQESTWKIVY